MIWSGTPETGLLSSHWLLSTASHTGDGAYRRATGKTLTYPILADCHARGNVIDDEWLIRDQGAMVRQMGWDLEDFARRQIAQEGGPDACVLPFSPATDRPGPYTGRGNGDEWRARLADLLARIMAADFAAIPQVYDRAALLEYPGGVQAHSHSGADRFWLGLRAAFPDAVFTAHHIIGRDDPLMPPRAAVRWSLNGAHSGWGRFGRPSGATVHVMGITHAEFGPFGPSGWGLRREFTLFDETAIWKQILLHTGAV